LTQKISQQQATEKTQMKWEAALLQHGYCLSLFFQCFKRTDSLKSHFQKSFYSILQPRVTIISLICKWLFGSTRIINNLENSTHLNLCIFMQVVFIAISQCELVILLIQLSILNSIFRASLNISYVDCFHSLLNSKLFKTNFESFWNGTTWIFWSNWPLRLENNW
jgi:hypothetical protein